jgi:crotonobetainyl-CoA:carnitine CoA-transferase CaiB-like acyl-CoA transferase
MSEKKGDPFVAIAGIIGGISLAIVVLIAVLARDQLMVATWVVAVLALMGVFLGAMAAKKKD